VAQDANKAAATVHDVAAQRCRLPLRGMGPRSGSRRPPVSAPMSQAGTPRSACSPPEMTRRSRQKKKKRPDKTPPEAAAGHGQSLRC